MTLQNIDYPHKLGILIKKKSIQKLKRKENRYKYVNFFFPTFTNGHAIVIFSTMERFILTSLLCKKRKRISPNHLETTNVIRMIELAFEREDYIVGKGENAGHKHNLVKGISVWVVKYYIHAVW